MRVLTAHGHYAPVESAAAGFLEGTALIDSGFTGSLELIPGPDGSGRTISYLQVYRENPWLWAAVQLVARGFSRMPVKLYDVDPDTRSKSRIAPSRDTVPGSLALVLRRPGFGRSWQAQQHATAIDRIVHGNSIWFPDRDRRGRFTAMRRIPYRFMRYEVIAGVERYWDVRRPQDKRIGDDVIHFGAWADGDSCWSPSSIGAMSTTLKLYDAIERHLVGFFRNSARPSGHVQVDRETSRPQRKIIRDAIAELYAGPDNAGRVLVTSGKWQPITQQNDHSKIVELVKLAREEIAAVIGVPPPLIGILDRAIMANVRELRSHYARDTMGPHVALFEGDIDAQILARDLELEELVAEVEMAAVLRPDIEARAQTFKDRRYVETLNEIRRTENLEVIDHPDANMPWMPLNEAPLGADNNPGGGEEPTDDGAGLYAPVPEEAKP